MNNFKEEWDLPFTHTLRYIDTLGKNAVLVTETDGIYVNKIKLVSDSRTTIDDTILFCINF